MWLLNFIGYVSQSNIYGFQKIDPKEEEAFNKFRKIETSGTEKSKTLYDMIQEKMAHKEADFSEQFGENDIEANYLIYLFIQRAFSG